MGATFAQPTYFYKEDTVPDLTDTNGPLYVRSSRIVSKLSVSSAYAELYCTYNDEHNNGATYSTTSDLSSDDSEITVVTETVLPMSDGDTQGIVKVGLIGSVNFNWEDIEIDPDIPSNFDMCRISLSLISPQIVSYATCQSNIMAFGYSPAQGGRCFILETETYS